MAGVTVCTREANPRPGSSTIIKNVTFCDLTKMRSQSTDMSCERLCLADTRETDWSFHSRAKPLAPFHS